MVKSGKAKGVVLHNGDEIYADVISSSVDPRLTFINFIEAGNLPDEFVEEVKPLQVPRIVRQSEHGARRAAEFQMPARRRSPSARRDVDFAQCRVHGESL